MESRAALDKISLRNIALHQVNGGCEILIHDQ